MIAERDLAPAQWSVLALLAEEPGHGWALAKQMAATGEVGRVWSAGRPLVYRALDVLEERGLIEPIGHEPGARGPNRTIFRPTDRGIAAVRSWLAEPVEHVRDGRSLLLLKLVFAERAEVDPRPLLRSQACSASAAIEALESRLEGAEGSEDILLRFRLESTRAVRRFVDGRLDELAPTAEAV